MKNAIAATVLSLSALAHAAPSADNYASVTNDWYQGNWTNVFELAQQRLAANTNDLVASHLMVSYDILFSDYQAMSNSIQRLVCALDSVSEPSLTNLCSNLRSGGCTLLTTSCRNRRPRPFRSRGRSPRSRTSPWTATSSLNRSQSPASGRRSNSNCRNFYTIYTAQIPLQLHHVERTD